MYSSEYFTHNVRYDLHYNQTNHYFRTFFPLKLKKHQKCCTQSHPMKNLSTLKGKASKLEALVNYPKHKQMNYQENYKCCCIDDDTQKDGKLETTINPSIEDFISILEDSQVLEDKSLSLQLLLLVHVFIRMKVDKDSENNVLPSL